MTTPKRASGATFADYCAIPALNWSTLKHLHTSALLLKYRSENPPKDKPAFAIGRAVHTAVLEPERWATDYPVAPDFGNLRTKAARADRDAWEAEHGAALSAKDHALCETISDAVRSHKVAAELLAVGRPEVTVEWDHDGLACKGRLDWLKPRGLVDLKTTRCETLREFTRDCSRYLYHGQLAFYEQGAKAAGLLPHGADMPIIIAAQTVEPYDVFVVRVAGLAIAAGRSLCSTLLAKYRACQAASYWPGIAPDEVDLELPGYAAGMATEEEEAW